MKKQGTPKPKAIKRKHQRLINLVKKWRRRADDYGPIPARVYYECANGLEDEIKKLPGQDWNDALEEAAQLIELASLGALGDELGSCFSSKSGCAALLADAIRAKKRVTD